MRILLVDDQMLLRDALQILLFNYGFEVVGVAADGLEALQQARNLHPELILMDIEMPNCDGLAATRLIKAEMPEIRIVMLSESTQDHDLFEAIRSGAMGYLLKNMSAKQFVEILHLVEQGEPPLSPGIAARVLDEFARLGWPTDPVAPVTDEDQPLVKRQMQVLTLVAQGQTYRQVGDILGLSERTVRYHMGRILQHLHLHNRDEVIIYAAQHGLVKHNP